MKTIKNKQTKKLKIKKYGGMKITYGFNGTITRDRDSLYEGQDFFRKMTGNENEIRICKLLMKNPHNNIVKIYAIGKDYIDMELLNTRINPRNLFVIKNEIAGVKTYLQSIGIMYIDWKLDNLGISKDKQFKLFDFDVSGLIDINTNKWLIEPPRFWSYNSAIGDGMEVPADIDNHAIGAMIASFLV